VGYTPPRRVVATPTPTPTADERERVRLRIAEVTAEEETAILGSIKMEGFLRTSTSLFAIMNQQIVSVGEKIRIRVQGRDREFMILDLTEETIRLRPL